MRRAKGPLEAVLSTNRMTVICGRCQADLAYVVHRRSLIEGFLVEWSSVPFGRLSGDTIPLAHDVVSSDPERILRFEAGWRLSPRGVWVVPPRGQQRLARGRSAWRRAPRVNGQTASFRRNGGAEPSRLPLKAQCPSCISDQLLDPVALDVEARPHGDNPPGDWDVAPIRSSPS